MTCTPAHGYVAFPIQAWSTVFTVLCFVALVEFGYALWKAQRGPEIKLKRRKRNWRL